MAGGTGNLLQRADVNGSIDSGRVLPTSNRQGIHTQPIVRENCGSRGGVAGIRSQATRGSIAGADVKSVPGGTLPPKLLEGGGRESRAISSWPFLRFSPKRTWIRSRNSRAALKVRCRATPLLNHVSAPPRYVVHRRWWMGRRARAACARPGSFPKKSSS